MYTIKDQLQEEISAIREEGLYKAERIIQSPQGAKIVANGATVLNFCANNYLGLSDDPSVLVASKKVIDSYGFGLSSVRFICGTQDIHKELEKKIARFVGMEDAILYAAAFDANGGLFEPLLSQEDAVLSDELNHASIIDGIRLCKAERYQFKHNDMTDLEIKLKEAKGARRKLIATDGVFSMAGTIAQLDKICDLADRYDAMVMIDDCHATGFIGETGRGSHELKQVMDRVDIITGTFGKALGGASGGFTAARKEIVELLRQKSRPYLFSNSLAPSIVGATITVLDRLSSNTELRTKLTENTWRFREKMKEAGFDIPEGNHPIVPVMLYDAHLTQEFANRLFKEGIYVIGFCYPVVPRGEARIRVQLSAVHENTHIDKAVTAFVKIGKAMGVIS